MAADPGPEAILNGISPPPDVKHHPMIHPRSRRFHVVLLLMMGFFVMALMTTNIGITLTCMVNSTAVAMELDASVDSVSTLEDEFLLNSTCKAPEGGLVIDYGGTYEWSVKVQGYIVGAAFVGGLISTIPGGYLIDKFSIRHLLSFAILLISFCNLMMPLTASIMGPLAVSVLRFIMGLGEGIMIPALTGVVTKWVPLHEKSTAASFFTSGNQLAGFFGNPMSAGLCASSAGWPAVFYLSGCMGLAWVVVWHFTVNNSPQKSRWMSDKELEYLDHHLPKDRKTEKKTYPVRAMFTSPPFLVLIYCAYMGNMMITFMLVYIPVYFKDVLYFDIRQNGLYAALPHVANLIAKLFWGTFVDYLKRKKIISPTFACKFSQIFAMTLMSLSFCLLGYAVDCTSPIYAVLLLCLCCAAFGLSVSGFLTSALSIAPNYIGVISSTTQFAGFLGRGTVPYIISAFKTIGTAEEWKKILLILSALSLLSGIVFQIFGSGDIQPWNKQRSAPKEKTMLPLVDMKLLEDGVVVREN